MGTQLGIDNFRKLDNTERNVLIIWMWEYLDDKTCLGNTSNLVFKDASKLRDMLLRIMRLEQDPKPLSIRRNEDQKRAEEILRKLGWLP